jgi:PTS system nitrogen regulatory IIA component
MYLNVVQLAESFGVEESVIKGWVRNEGLPSVPDRGRLLFDGSVVVQWAAQRGLVAKAGFLAPSRPAGGAAPRLEPMLRTGGIWRDVPAAGVFDTLETIVTKLPGAVGETRELLVRRLRAPDGVSWAPVGGGVALPHLRASVALGRDAGTLALLALREPLGTIPSIPDAAPVTRLLFFVAPSPRAHLEMLAQLSAALTHGKLGRLMLEGAPDVEIFAALAQADTARAEKKAAA